MFPDRIDCVDGRAARHECAVQLPHIFERLRPVQRQFHQCRSAARKQKEHQRLFIAVFQQRENCLCGFPALFIWRRMPGHKILDAGYRLACRGWRGHDSLESHKWRQHGCEPFHHRMRRFSNRHHSQLVKFTQIENIAVAVQPRSLAPQFSLHRRGNINGSQCFVENPAGELLQIRHGRFAEKLLKMPSRLPDSACSAAVAQ